MIQHNLSFKKQKEFTVPHPGSSRSCWRPSGRRHLEVRRQVAAFGRNDTSASPKALKPGFAGGGFGCGGKRLHLMGHLWFSNKTAGTRRLFCAADFQVCRLASRSTGQTCWLHRKLPHSTLGRPANLEIGDTAGWETCATARAPGHWQPPFRLPRPQGTGNTFTVSRSVGELSP